MYLRRDITPHEVRSSIPPGGGVGFVFHATDWDTLGFSFADVPPRSAQLDRFLWEHPPIIGSVIRSNGQVIGANIISPVPAELWTESPTTIRRFRTTHLHRCLELASECGIRLASLGALTPYACDYGRSERPNMCPAITTGHAATAAVLRRCVLSICDRLAIDIGTLRLAVFGAAGMMGQGTLAAFSSMPCRELILIDFAAKRSILERRLAQVVAAPTTAAKKFTLYVSRPGDGLPAFDGAVLVTNATTPFLSADDLRRAKFWVDDSHPRAASVEAERATRGETLYVECYARGPAGLDTGYPFRLPTTQDCYACFAEGYVAWAEGYETDFMTGPPDLPAISRADALLAKYGFVSGPLCGKDGTLL